MEIADLIPDSGTPQRIYCAKCSAHTELAYTDFEEIVSEIVIGVVGLPVLHCPKCGHDQLPDCSRFAVMKLHEEAMQKTTAKVTVTRNKRTDSFGFADIPFVYDPDDYFYIPGLYRSFNEGFLQPVFFNRSVLLKYDNAPGYSVKFASTTYGTIDIGSDDIAFGINRHGHVVMWLGDIAKLPVNEQYYLRSENVESDHSLGSEFYDGQIECVFTPRAQEDELFRLRSEFMDKFRARFGVSVGHLEAEALDLALSFNPPVVDTPKERRHVADTLNKLYLESLDNKALESVVSSLGVKSLGSGSLKRLQAIMQSVAPTQDIAVLMSPLYVLYDFRVECSHLTSDKARVESVLTRLNLLSEVALPAIYKALMDGLQRCFEGMVKIVAGV